MSDAAVSPSDKDARIAALEAALAAARADISARDLLIDTLRVQIARLRRMQFGQSSEKLDGQIPQLELALASFGRLLMLMYGSSWEIYLITAARLVP